MQAERPDRPDDALLVAGPELSDDIRMGIVVGLQVTATFQVVEA
jgi:hypothetical protein